MTSLACLLPPGSMLEDGVHSIENALGLSQLSCGSLWSLGPAIPGTALCSITFAKARVLQDVPLQP